MFLVNGVPATDISLADRSFQYGDGCFTTILTKYGEPQDWQLHLERMQACLLLLQINIPNWSQIEAWVEKAAVQEPLAGIKLHISRGEGGRGYSPIGADNAVVTINSFSYPTHYPTWKANGVSLGVCQLKLGISPLLAGHKHNNRLEQVLLKLEAEQQGYQDALAFDIEDRLIETTMANLFWIRDDIIYTPDLSLCGVAGVGRRKVIQQAEKLNLVVKIGQFDIKHIHAADEVFMTNALLGVAPVTQIGNVHFDIGNITRRFQEKLSS